MAGVLASHDSATNECWSFSDEVAYLPSLARFYKINNINYNNYNYCYSYIRNDWISALYYIVNLIKVISFI